MSNCCGAKGSLQFTDIVNSEEELMWKENCELLQYFSNRQLY